MTASEEQLKSLMIGSLDGDVSAHTALLEALTPVLRSYYRRRVRDESVLEDLMQETLIAIHFRRASFERDKPFTAWLFAIARYKLVDHFRRSRSYCQIAHFEETLGDEGFEAASNAALDVKRLLATLPARQAEAIRLTHLEGLSVAEAARAAGIRESNVKVSVHRGLKSLSAMLRGTRHGH